MVNNIVKIIFDKEILEKGLVPFSITIMIIIISIVLTIILAKKEIKGVKENEKN